MRLQTQSQTQTRAQTRRPSASGPAAAPPLCPVPPVCPDPGPKYRGPLHCLTTVAREEGLRGLYKGSSALLLRESHSFATYFLSYTILCEWLTPSGHSQPGEGTRDEEEVQWEGLGEQRGELGLILVPQRGPKPRPKVWASNIPLMKASVSPLAKRVWVVE